MKKPKRKDFVNYFTDTHVANEKHGKDTKGNNENSVSPNRTNRCVLVTQSCPTLATPWTVAHWAPPSMGFSRKEYWQGLPFPSPHRANAGIEIMKRNKLQFKLNKLLKIKDRNGMELTEAKDLKKRWQEYTKELYTKELHDPDNHDYL